VQRIPSKIYDYLATDRPVLMLADNPEMASMLAPFAGVTQLALDDAAGLAGAIQRAMASRGERFERDVSCFDSRVATEQLAAILKRAIAHGR